MDKIDKLREFVKKEFSNCHMREFENKFVIALNLFGIDCFDGTAMSIELLDDGRYKLSDCHSSIDSLEERMVDISDYKDELERIKSHFYKTALEQDGNVFEMTVPTDNENYLSRYIGYMTQFMSLVMNIDCLK